MSDGNKYIDEMCKAASIAGEVQVHLGEGESSANLGKFVTILGQTYSYITPYVEADKQYSVDDIVKLINDSGVFSVRAKKTPDGKSVVNDDDAISIIESVVWSIYYLQTGIAVDMVPAVALTEEYSGLMKDSNDTGNLPWNCIVMKDQQREGAPHRIFGNFVASPCMISRVGNTVIDLQNRSRHA